jgi:hypothetical protein
MDALVVLTEDRGGPQFFMDQEEGALIDWLNAVTRINKLKAEAAKRNRG